MTEEPLRLVYVEDDPSSRRLISLIIEATFEGSQVTIFEDSANFLERVRALASVPHLFFLDVHIKPYSGYEMLKLLQGDPNYRQVPCIAMTASVMTDEIKSLQAAGFHGLIAKPVRKKTLPELIVRILAGESVWVVS